MHIFGLILFAGMVSSSTVRQVSISQTTGVGILTSELESSTGLSSTTILETSTLSDKNDDHDCICTLYYLCKSYKANYDNNGLINIVPNVIKRNPCQHYLDVCCDDTNITSTEKYESSSPDKSITLEHIITTEPDKTSYEEPQKCGTWNKHGIGFGPGEVIDNESEYGEFPSMVAIFREELSKDGEKKLVLHCGGSLIEKDVILTTAHCVIKTEDISTFVVRAGEWDLKTDNELFDHQDRRVSKIIIHPHYYVGGLHNDVALIFTENMFTLQENINLICLPSKNDIFINNKCYSSGWDETVSCNNYSVVQETESEKTNETGKQHQVQILKKIELPIVDRNKCINDFRATKLGPKFVLHDSFMCAGGMEGKDTCKGDDGGPLMCPHKDDPDRLVQVGIVAWDISGGSANTPGAYVDVAGFVHWIKNEIEKKRVLNKSDV